MRGPLARVFIAVALGTAAAFVTSAPHSQELEPRLYANAPIGMNFAIAGYAYTQGGVSVDPAIPLDDAKIEVHSAVVAYAHSFAAWGRSAKFDAIGSYSSLSGRADLAGERQTRDVSGWGDPRLRVSINFHGAPALGVREIKSYRQDLIVGASLTVWPPLGQYDETRLIDIGTHRWSVKPEIGLSKALGPWIVELIGARSSMKTTMTSSATARASRIPFTRCREAGSGFSPQARGSHCLLRTSGADARLWMVRAART